MHECRKAACNASSDPNMPRHANDVMARAGEREYDAQTAAASAQSAPIGLVIAHAANAGWSFKHCPNEFRQFVCHVVKDTIRNKSIGLGKWNKLRCRAKGACVKRNGTTAAQVAASSQRAAQVIYANSRKATSSMTLNCLTGCPGCKRGKAREPKRYTKRPTKSVSAGLKPVVQSNANHCAQRANDVTPWDASRRTPTPPRKPRWNATRSA